MDSNTLESCVCNIDCCPFLAWDRRRTRQVSRDALELDLRQDVPRGLITCSPMLELFT